MSAELDAQVSQTISARRERFATLITERHFDRHPELDARYGAAGRAKCFQDAHFHLGYLAEAIAASQPELFADYVAWAKVLLEGRGVPAKDLAGNLGIIRETLLGGLPGKMAAVATAYVDAGLNHLPRTSSDLPSFIPEGGPLAELARAYLGALLRGDRREAGRLVREAVDAGTSVGDIYLHVFERSLHEVGRLWQMNLISVAREHYCTAATQLIMSQLYPHIFASERNGHTLVATCVSGDLHEIGVRMVSDFFEMDGWDTFYLGANAPTPSVVETIADRDADCLAVSATITSHLRAVSELILAVRASKECGRVKILVGGYPFNVAPELWRRVGADACAGDARASVDVARRLVDGNGTRA